MTITFLTINARGLNHPAKRRSMWLEAIQNKADVICVQETHFKKQAQPNCSHPKFPHVFFASTDAKKKGVLTAIKDTVAFSLHSEVKDVQGRYHILICNINNTNYTVVNVYAPNTRQTRFLHRLMKQVSRLQKGRLLLCGDFNLPPDPTIDSSSLSNKRTQTLQPLLRNYDIYDAWRCLHATE